MTLVLPSIITWSNTDLLMRALSHGAGGVSHCHLLITLPEDELREALASESSVTLLGWLSSLRSRRTFHRLDWVADPTVLAATFVVSEQSIIGDLSSIIPEQIHPLDRAFTCSVLKSTAGRAAFLMSWDHTLLDAHAAELIVAVLFGNSDKIVPFGAMERRSPKLRQVVRATKEFGQFLKNTLSSDFEIISEKISGDFKRVSFEMSAENSNRVRERVATLNVGIFPSSFFIACSTEALARLLCKPLRLVVSVPHDARKKGGKRIIFPNELSLVVFKLVAGEGNLISQQISVLISQFSQIVRQGVHRLFTDFLHIGRWLPSSLYSKLLFSVHKSGFCSMYVSYVGENPLFQEIPGIEAQHYPPHFARPGISFVYWWVAKRLHCSVIVGAEVLSELELSRIIEVVTEVLLHEW